MLRDRIVCRITDTGRQRQLLAEPDLIFEQAFKMVQAWETAESNAKDLQKPQQGPILTVNRTELMPTTKPSQGATINSSGANNTSCRRCGGSILHLNANIDRQHVTCVKRKSTWLESAKVDNRQIAHLLARNFKLDSKAELTYLIQQSNPVMNLTCILCLQLLATHVSLS